VSVLAELGAFLVTQGLGVLDSTLFLGTLPPDQTEGTVIVALREYPGLEGVMGFGSAGIKEETPGIQVIVRGDPNSYAPVRAKAELVYRALATVEAQSLSGTFYHSIHPRQPPSDILGKDENQRVRISFNVLAEKEPSAA
jgi:hypothetical protein